MFLLSVALGRFKACYHSIYGKRQKQNKVSHPDNLLRRIQTLFQQKFSNPFTLKLRDKNTLN